ncbi:MAG: hypothetical protein J6T28_12955 [Paludibacteraceae bacterium]|nr:hypothetical protein [Paludibacteraceae bacterium]
MQNDNTSFCLSDKPAIVELVLGLVLELMSQLVLELVSELVSELMLELVSELVPELVLELVLELMTELVPEFGRLNVIQTNVPSVPYSGSGNLAFLQASTIRLTPVPQLSKKAVMYNFFRVFLIRLKKYSPKEVEGDKFCIVKKRQGCRKFNVSNGQMVFSAFYRLRLE